MKEQENSPEVQLKEMYESILSDREFRAMIITA